MPSIVEGIALIVSSLATNVVAANALYLGTYAAIATPLTGGCAFIERKAK